MSVVDEISVGELISLAARNASGNWEERFVLDLEERFEEFGDRIYLSPKQRVILERIADAVPRFEPLKDKSEDGYVAPAPTLLNTEVYEALRLQLEVDLGEIAVMHPTAPDVVLKALIKIAGDHGWRFVPDDPTEEMKSAWANTASVFPGTSTAKAHCEVVYREMLQKAPAIVRGE
jgi:hypothetical protein